MTTTTTSLRPSLCIHRRTRRLTNTPAVPRSINRARARHHVKKGPNDTRHVVWAMGTCFKGTRRVHRVTTTKTGPNDVSRRIVWAISMFF